MRAKPCHQHERTGRCAECKRQRERRRYYRRIGRRLTAAQFALTGRKVTR